MTSVFFETDRLEDARMQDEGKPIGQRLSDDLGQLNAQNPQLAVGLRAFQRSYLDYLKMSEQFRTEPTDTTLGRAFRANV
jgi:hypothetical protein